MSSIKYLQDHLSCPQYYLKTKTKREAFPLSCLCISGPSLAATLVLEEGVGVLFEFIFAQLVAAEALELFKGFLDQHF